MRQIDIPHYSVSQLVMYERCGHQYMMRYKEKKRSAPGFTLIRGKSVHKGREVNLKQKIESHVDVPIDVVRDAVRDNVSDQFKDEITIDEEHEGQSIKTIKGNCVDSSIRLIEADYETFQKTTQPLDVERKLTARIDGLGGRVLLGYMDLRDDRYMIRDCKTKTKTPSQRTVDVDEQLTTYQLLAMANGLKVDGLAWDVLVDLKTETKAEAFTTERTKQDMQALLNRMTVSIKGIEAGVFIPCPTGNWMCCAKFCGFWNQCPYSIGRGRGI